jgi:putative spermidine/putrescine transport system ATP-binding protein
MTSNTLAGVGNQIEFRGIEKSFGNTQVLRNLNLTVEAGEFVALLGPSGCGKTTALRILGGFEQPTEGDVLVNGKSLLGLPPHKRDIGMVFQAYSLFPNLTVGKNVDFGLSLRRVPRDERRARVRELLALVRLSGFEDRYPSQLSGGQQQRVALARALAIQPGILLLDEPLSALDAQVRAGLREEIAELHRNTGVTVVFVTHDQEEAMAMADRVAVMSEGQIRQIASPNTLFYQPSDPFVGRFIGTVNELHVAAGSPVPEVWQPPQAGSLLSFTEESAELDRLFVRPDALVCEPSTEAVAEVVSHMFLGSATRITVRTFSGDHEVKIDLPSHLVVTVPVGERVAIRLTQPPVYRLAGSPAAAAPTNVSSIAAALPEALILGGR